MAVLKRGNRLSITPVEPAHWHHRRRAVDLTSRPLGQSRR
jgi:hypothetical protein